MSRLQGAAANDFERQPSCVALDRWTINGRFLMWCHIMGINTADAKRAMTVASRFDDEASFIIAVDAASNIVHRDGLAALQRLTMAPGVRNALHDSLDVRRVRGEQLPPEVAQAEHAFLLLQNSLRTFRAENAAVIKELSDTIKAIQEAEASVFAELPEFNQAYLDWADAKAWKPDVEEMEVVRSMYNNNEALARATTLSAFLSGYIAEIRNDRTSDARMRVVSEMGKGGVDGPSLLGRFRGQRAATMASCLRGLKQVDPTVVPTGSPPSARARAELPREDVPARLQGYVDRVLAGAETLADGMEG